MMMLNVVQPLKLTVSHQTPLSDLIVLHYKSISTISTSSLTLSGSGNTLRYTAVMQGAKLKQKAGNSQKQKRKSGMHLCEHKNHIHQYSPSKKA